MNELAGGAGMAWFVGVSGQCWVLERAEVLSGSQESGKDVEKKEKKWFNKSGFFQLQGLQTFSQQELS